MECIIIEILTIPQQGFLNNVYSFTLFPSLSVPSLFFFFPRAVATTTNIFSDTFYAIDITHILLATRLHHVAAEGLFNGYGDVQVKGFELWFICLCVWVCILGHLVR